MTSAAPSPYDRHVVSLLIAALCANAAYAAIGTVLGLQVFNISHRELDLGLLGMAQFAPAFLLVLVTGSTADRYDRALVAGMSALGQAAVSVGLAIYASLAIESVGPIFALVLLLGVARAFLSAAQGPLPADIVTPDRLPWLVARRSLASRPGLILGPIIAGALYIVSPVLPYLAIAVLFAVASGFLWIIHLHLRHAARQARRVADETPSKRFRESLEGLRVIRDTPLLLGAISLDLFAVLFGGAVALLPAIAEDQLGVDAVGLGVLRGAAGVGSGIVLIALALRPVERHVGRTLLGTVAIFGAATVVLGATSVFLVAVVAVAVLAGADSISVFIRSNLVPLSSPADKRGRVAAVESLFVGASNELGAFESGITGQLWGSSVAVIVGGLATLGVVGAYTTLFPTLGRLDRYPGVEGDAAPPARDLTAVEMERDASIVE